MLQAVPKQRIFNVPTSVMVIVGLLVAIFALQANVSDQIGLELVRIFAFVPARVAYFLDPASMQKIMQLAGQGSDAANQSALAQYFLGQARLQPWTFLTYALLHGSWSHVLLNCLWFFSFGAAVARRFGTVRFVGLFIATAICGAVMHYLVHPLATEPVIGASAAVSGCMGAALRFAFAPGAPLGESNGLGYLNADATYHLPAPNFISVLTNSRAMSFLGVWFVVNLVVGVATTNFGYGDAPIAWEAHVGGLLGGFLLFGLFDHRKG